MKNLMIVIVLTALSFGGQAQALSLAPPPECSTPEQRATLVCQVQEHCAAQQARVTKLVARQWELSQNFALTRTDKRFGSTSVLKTTSSTEQRLARIARRLDTARAALQSCIDGLSG